MGELIVHLLEEMIQRVLVVGSDGEADGGVYLVVLHRQTV